MSVMSDWTVVDSNEHLNVTDQFTQRKKLNFDLSVRAHLKQAKLFNTAVEAI